MGRTVSTPTDARWNIILYQHELIGKDEPNEADYEFFWDDFIEDVHNVFTEAATKLNAGFMVCDKWLGRDCYRGPSEDHAVIELWDELAEHIYIGVSEYCGVISLWCVDHGDLEPDPYDDEEDDPIKRAALIVARDQVIEGLYAAAKAAWCKQAMAEVGRFSNGEAVYAKAS